MITKKSLSTTADWHVHHAFKAYWKGDYDTYARHILIADRLRVQARGMK